jgi:Rrf2 family protein
MLMEMAMHPQAEHCNLADIAVRQNISARYLEQIAAELKRNDIIKSVRGAHGGYRLNVAPDDITLNELLTILEGDLRIVEPEESFSLLEQCLQQNVYDPLSREISAYLGNVTLGSLAERAKFDLDANMFYV